jgi:L-lactate dehydrogenase complex protein LldG
VEGAELSSRDQILASVRGALGRSAGDPVAEPAAPILRLNVTPAEDRVGQFQAAFEALVGKAHLAATPREAGAVIREIVGTRTFVASRSPLIEACGIAGSEFSREVCATTDVGVTAVDYGLADTGSLVVLTQSHESRLLSLLPPCHIAVLDRSRLVENLDELLMLHPDPAAASSGMVIITGPSRTADIEMLLVRGVHGPGEIHVIIVQDVTEAAPGASLRI